MKQFAVTALLILSVTKYVEPVFKEISLSSKNQERKVFWTLENEKKSIHVPAKVPGGVYSDLQDAGKIEDILKGYNDLGTRWVANATWIYRVSFNIQEEDLQANVVQLVLHGIDTLSFIELNGALIDSTSNMFVRYVFDIKQHLRPGDNELKISFVPPIEAANARLSTSSAEPYCVPATYHGECHINQLRKMQTSFAWDFAPAFPSVGLWKPISIELYDGAIIRSVTVHTKKTSTHWKLIIVNYLETPKTYGEIKGVISAVLTVKNNNTIKEGKNFAVSTNEEGTLVKRLNLKIPIQDVDVWWPNGYGKQPLYELNVFVFTAGNKGENYQKTIQIGFRTVELVEERTGVGAHNTTGGRGRTFFFKINGYPLFMKGANWVPAHILPEHSGDERVVDLLLQSAHDAHMTMLRVWGGGLYESDYFYQRCDELGILVWQDFLFSCAMYPTDPEFLESVSLEVQQNVIRLQHHPSLAIWAGNNEIELALRGNWFPSSRDFETNFRDYVKLFVDTIKPIVKELDPGRRYLVSSPSNGLEAETKREFISDNPGDSHFGDTHHYVHYMADNWDASSYFYTRFASEYGFQSLPSIETMSKAIDDEDELNIYSEYSQHRQHSPNRYTFIEKQIDLHLGEYDKTFHSNDYEKYIFYSQIVQAMALKTATEFYRQSRAYWNTMGALYWQLNDVWQAPSASSIEYGGKWKMVHYFAKRFFAPILVSARLLPDGDIDIYVINDKISPIVDAEIIVDVFNWTSLTPISSNMYKVSDIEPLSSTKQDIKIVLWDKLRNTEIFIRFSLRKKGVALSPFNFVFPAPFKSVSLIKNGNIKVTVQPRLRQQENKFHYKVFIQVDTVILFLWLEAENQDGKFQDNGLIITEPFTYVNFVSNKILKPLQLQKSIKWRYYHK